MAKEPEFDLKAAHRYFAANCFNQAWDLIDKNPRTPDEDKQMIRLSLASVYHWTQRPDCTPETMSIGYWQNSRVYALVGQAVNARHYGLLALSSAQNEGVLPFALGYAFEALARAEALAGNDAQKASYLTQARQVAKTLADPETKKQLLADLDTIR